MIIFVGDKPSPRMKPGAKPFKGAACEALLTEWVEVLVPSYSPYKLYNSHTAGAMQNILIHYNNFRGCNGLLRCMKSKVIALGNNASKRLTACHVEHFKLPHPSGLNRQINDKAFIEQKLKECKEWLCRT